jgi:Cu(I)/Ag(I) efflux system protein CusF
MMFIPCLRTLLTGVALLAASSLSFSADWAHGEIRKIDKAAGKVTIKHGDIPSIEMPPMTMVFTVKDPALLEAAKPGDKIRFDVIQEAGKLVVTRMETDQ